MMLFRKNKGKTNDDTNISNSLVENNNEKTLIVQDKDKERPCLLPSALASRITTMTTSSCLTIRNASSVVDTLYELAKAGTDASFDISRNIFISAIKIARSIHRDEENENPNSFIKALDACTDFGINVINNTFSATEVMTLTSFHLAQKGLRYTFKWAEEALNVLDSVFGKTETSREISALLSLVQSEIGNYVKDEKNIIKKGVRSINFVKAITAYACLQIMTYETILKKRKLTLLYEGDTYLESVPLSLIKSEEEDFFSIMNTTNDNDDDDAFDNNNINNEKIDNKNNEDNNKNNKNNENNDKELKDYKNLKKERNDTTKLLLSTLALSKSSINENKKSESPLKSDDVKKSYLDEALYNMNNYSPAFANSISNKLSPEILNFASSQDEMDSSSSDNNSNNDKEEIDPEKYIYPKQHLVKNIAKFIKFASGVYGRHFMRFLDIGDMRTTTTVDTYLHPNDYAFSIHTNTPLENILYSSYSSKTTSTTNNIAHIISVDHDMKAIIVSLRGTLGFYDFIIDLQFDYITITYNNKEYHVHNGIYQSAKIISQPNSVIHNIVRVALNDYPDYGLVLCGHSLGGGVASMLGLLWTDPEKPYVTGVDSKLPPNRPLHVYSYGTPGCMDESLAKHCRMFITTVVNHYDIIPRLSIGILTDLRNCADVLLDEKNHGLAEEIFSRSLATFNKSNSDKELNWFWDKFLHLKKHMNTEKLLPPGVVYIVETTDVPVMEQSNYDINNLSEMEMSFNPGNIELFNNDVDVNVDDHDNDNGSNSNQKRNHNSGTTTASATNTVTTTSTKKHTRRLSSSSNHNLAYVDMIIDSIHNHNPTSPVYEKPILEENDEDDDDTITTSDDEDTEKMIDIHMSSITPSYQLSDNNKEKVSDKEEKEEVDNDMNIEKETEEKEEDNMNIEKETEEEEEDDDDDNHEENKLHANMIPIPEKRLNLLEDINLSSSSSSNEESSEMNITSIEESSFADIDEDEEILELNVTDENRKRRIEQMKKAAVQFKDFNYNYNSNNNKYPQNQYQNQDQNHHDLIHHQGFEDNKQGRLYTSPHTTTKKSSKYYSRTPSTLPNKNDTMKRVILLRCDDVKEHFSELAIAKCMFFDHAPVNYENLLNALEKAVFKNSI